MKTSIRTRFTLGVVFFLVIILLLSVLSAFYLNMLSGKTRAILKENHYSVIFARDMSHYLTNINQEVTSNFLANKNSDSIFINKELELFSKSLQLEKNNITEPGEDKLAMSIEMAYFEYRDSVKKFIKSPKQVYKAIYLQNKFNSLYQQLMLLSQMNEKAIEVKTNDTKISAKNASIQMTIVGSLCFLIAFGFTFSFGSYFNERFFQLYNGIKEIVSSNYGHRLHFDRKDEFQEIALVFNEMAEKLSENKKKIDLPLQLDAEKDSRYTDIQELKIALDRLKSAEEQAKAIISKFEIK
jgi:two-component system, NtrC family, sensor histidine kinase KinB